MCIFCQQNYSHLISDSLVRRMYNIQVRFACLIYFSRDQSSIKLIIFLDSKLERLNSRVAKLDSRLDSRVEFLDSRVTVNLPLSDTVSVSDHSLVYAFHKISINSPKGHSTLTYRKFNNFDSTRFCYDISTQDWGRVNNYDDPNVMWDIWKNLFFLCVDKQAPLRTKRIRTPKSPWITPQLKTRMHYKDILKVKAIRSGNACDWLIF